MKSVPTFSSSPFHSFVPWISAIFRCLFVVAGSSVFRWWCSFDCYCIVIDITIGCEKCSSDKCRLHPCVLWLCAAFRENWPNFAEFRPRASRSTPCVRVRVKKMVPIGKFIFWCYYGDCAQFDNKATVITYPSSTLFTYKKKTNKTHTHTKDSQLARNTRI